MAESISEGTLKTWLKQPGDAVEADEEIATIETDKVRHVIMRAEVKVLTVPRSTYPSMLRKPVPSRNSL